MPPLVKRILIILFSIAWIPIGGELYLRLFAPANLMPRFVQAGEHGVRENVPGSRYFHQTVDYSVSFEINEQGIRDPRVFESRPPEDTLRILLLGDSFGMGYGVSYEDSVPSLVEGHLEAALGRPIEVVNLSVSGLGTAEQLVILDDRGWALDPDFLVLYWQTTDRPDNVRSRLFGLDEGRLVRLNDSYLPAVKIREKLFSYPAYRWMAQHSHFYSWIRNSAGIYTRQLLAAWRSKDAEPASTASTASAPEKVGYAERLSAALLGRIREQCRAHDVGFISMSVPVRRGRGNFFDAFPVDGARALGLEFDPISPIACFEADPEKLYYWENSAGHWTPVGAACVAGIISDKILLEMKASPGGEPGRSASDPEAPRSPGE